jgi:threonine dehydrogenase-like Zn-dependent dehydrogenase
MMKEIVVRMIMAYDDKDFAETVADFVAGKFQGVEKMVTARISIEDVKEKGFEQLIKNKDQHVKILATPRKELLAT